MFNSDFQNIRVGDQLTFDYNKSGQISRRSGEVVEKMVVHNSGLYGRNLLRVKTLAGFRTFACDSMTGVHVLIEANWHEVA